MQLLKIFIILLISALHPNPLSDHCPLPDRYDGRGHLHDLSEYDSGSWNTSYQLSEEEARIEALCDEERYLALHTDLLEEEARQGGRGSAHWASREGRDRENLMRSQKVLMSWAWWGSKSFSSMYFASSL